MSELTPAEMDRLRHDASAGYFVELTNSKILWLLDAADERDRLREALTPSAETKAAYIGEFTVLCQIKDTETDEEIEQRVAIPWTTVKEIMAAILTRANATAAIAAARKGTIPPYDIWKNSTDHERREALED